MSESVSVRIEQEVDIEVTVVCDTCGDELGTTADDGGDSNIDVCVEPCEVCAEETRNKLAAYENFLKRVAEALAQFDKEHKL